MQEKTGTLFQPIKYFAQTLINPILISKQWDKWIFYFIFNHIFLCALFDAESKTAILLVLCSNLVCNYRAY